ncbi:hypothetical protein [Neobacillus vireti]|uniref:hypothetical protein n=1 Tax=Neobacillus vireti TaxID=220686 RepID=UPI002FFF059C
MAYFYLVSTIGSGKKLDPYRPNIPDGVEYVGAEKNGKYIILTDTLMQDDKKSGIFNVTDKVNDYLANQGLTQEDITKWFVG